MAIFSEGEFGVFKRWIWDVAMIMTIESSLTGPKPQLNRPLVILYAIKFARHPEMDIPFNVIFFRKTSTGTRWCPLVRLVGL